MSIWTSYVKIWSVCNLEFNANSLTFWGLYHLSFDLETIGVRWLIFEKKSKSIMAENLNSGLSYLITTVCNWIENATGRKCNKWLFFYPVDPLTLYVLKELLARVWNALDWLLSLGSAQPDQTAKTRQNLTKKIREIDWVYICLPPRTTNPRWLIH